MCVNLEGIIIHLGLCAKDKEATKRYFYQISGFSNSLFSRYFILKFGRFPLQCCQLKSQLFSNYYTSRLSFTSILKEHDCKVAAIMGQCCKNKYLEKLSKSPKRGKLNLYWQHCKEIFLFERLAKFLQ